MKPLNCWEWKKCGREPGGANAEGDGCVVARERRADGINNGSNGGRYCWAIRDANAETPFKNKLCFCLQCDFLAAVQEQEGVDFVLLDKVRDPIR